MSEQHQIKFSSRRDIAFTITILGTVAFLSVMLVRGWSQHQFSNEERLVTIPIALLVLFMLWCFVDTSYTLTKEELTYRSGPIRGQISIPTIKEIEVGKTLWVGFKPATARKGLVIKYDKYNEVYITPKSNEAFIHQILEFKQDIHIVRKDT